MHYLSINHVYETCVTSNNLLSPVTSTVYYIFIVLPGMVSKLQVFWGVGWGEERDI